MKRQIMKGLMALCTAVMTVCATSFFTSCEQLDVLDEQVKDLQGQIDGLDQRLKDVEALKDQLTALTNRVTALEGLKFQVSSTTNELQYSIDGTTWKNSGVMLAKLSDVQLKVEGKDLKLSVDGGANWTTVTTLAEDCDKAFTHKLEDGKLWYKFADGDWTDTGVYVVDPATHPEIALEEDGNSVTITFDGNKTFTIEKPVEINFGIEPAKVVLAPMEKTSDDYIYISATGIDDLTVLEVPEGWTAEIKDSPYADEGDTGKVLVITAPAGSDTTAEKSGYVKVHATSTDGRCMVGKIAVELALTVEAYGGVLRVDYNGYNGYIIGASTKAAYEADMEILMQALENQDQMSFFQLHLTMMEESVEMPLPDFINGLFYDEGFDEDTEYVVWALDYGVMYTGPYNLGTVVSAPYKPVVVNPVEDEAQKTPFDVYVDVSVKGVEKYYATAAADDNLETIKEGILTSVQAGQKPEYGYVQTYTSDYSGYLTGINITNELSLKPGQNVHLILLPLDGRPADKYTEADVIVKTYKTKELASGSLIKLTGAQSNSGDLYTELAVDVTTTSEDFAYIYWIWMDENGLDAFEGKTNDEKVKALFENEEVTATEYDYFRGTLECGETLEPGDSRTLLAFCIDNEGKYGEVLQVKATTKTIELIDATVTLTGSNLTETNMLINKTDLELTLSSDPAVTKYRYWLMLESYKPQFEGKSGPDFAKELVLSFSAREIATDADGKITLTGQSYGNKYAVAIIPVTADGKYGNNPIVVRFECKFELPTVTEVSVAPEFVSYATSATTAGGYSITVDVTAPENTEAKLLIVNNKQMKNNSNDLFGEGKTAQVLSEYLWTNTSWPYGSTFRTVATTEKQTYTNTPSMYPVKLGEDADPTEPVILMSWKTGDNYYFYMWDLREDWNDKKTELGL